MNVWSERIERLYFLTFQGRWRGLIEVFKGLIGSYKQNYTGHWKATGRILGNFLWKFLYKNLDLKGGGTGSGEGTLPLYPPL